MRYFDQPDTQAKYVEVKAIKRGTATTAFGNFHFDPDGKDPLSRRRSIRQEAALFAKQRGLVRIVGEGGEDEAEELAAENLRRSTGVVADRRRQASLDSEHDGLKQVFGAGGADTRDTTAFEQDPSRYARTGSLSVERIDGEQEGVVQSSDIEGDDDEDKDDDMLGGGDTPPADPASAQEGNATGGDTPPRDDTREAEATNGTSDQDGSGGGNSETGDHTAQIAQETTAQGGGVADAPKPRRSRSRAADSADS